MASQQIVASVRQEAIGLDQVSTAMAEINRATVHFVSSADRTKDSADQLGEMASRMRKSITAYKV
jgi:methyl-accepting chemotaxis protein